MRIAIIGYGKMGHMIEEVAVARGHEIVLKINIENTEDFTEENIKNALMESADSLDSRGELLHPVRYALSGSDTSPDPFIISDTLGKNETISRLQKAI